jgi:hypothetical protein
MNSRTNAVTTSESFSEKGRAVTSVENASTAMAGKEKAKVEARYIMALRNPRDLEVVRQELLRECSIPSAADNKSMYYRKPIGDGVEGLGIRFAEICVRCMKNIYVNTQVISKDDNEEVHEVSVTDLESNASYETQIVVPRTVERAYPESDGFYFSVRKNSKKKDVYTVHATEDDMLNKRGALISKALRTLVLRVVPGWLQDECKTRILKTRADQDAADPAAARRKITDAFASLNISAKMLGDWLGHDVGTITPKELQDLRGMYGAISDGEATWQQFVDAKNGAGAEDGDGADAGVQGPTAKSQAAPPAAEPPAADPPPPAAAAEPPAAAEEPNLNAARKGQKAMLEARLKTQGRTLQAAMEECGITDYENLTVDGLDALKEFVGRFEGGGRGD